MSKTARCFQGKRNWPLIHSLIIDNDMRSGTENAVDGCKRKLTQQRSDAAEERRQKSDSSASPITNDQTISRALRSGTRTQHCFSGHQCGFLHWSTFSTMLILFRHNDGLQIKGLIRNNAIRCRIFEEPQAGGGLSLKSRF
jgi:hypothetical protein